MFLGALRTPAALRRRKSDEGTWCDQCVFLQQVRWVVWPIPVFVEDVRRAFVFFFCTMRRLYKSLDRRKVLDGQKAVCSCVDPPMCTSLRRRRCLIHHGVFGTISSSF